MNSVYTIGSALYGGTNMLSYASSLAELVAKLKDRGHTGRCILRALIAIEDTQTVTLVGKHGITDLRFT